MSLQDYLSLSHRYGMSITDVQGAGGNVSVKENHNELLIKASGTYLKDVTETNPGAHLRYDALKNSLYTHQHSPVTQDLENNLNEIVASSTISVWSRASMETPLHALIPRKYILHTHNIYVNVFGCAHEGNNLLHAILDTPFGRIPMTVPGLALAQEVMKRYGDQAPSLLFLENHGIIVSEDSSQALSELYDSVIQSLCQFLSSHGIPMIPDTYHVEMLDDNSYSISLLPSIAESFETMHYLTSSFLYPDAVVFGNSITKEKIHFDTNSSSVTIHWLPHMQASSVLENIAALNYIIRVHQQLWRSTRFLRQDLVDYIQSMEQEKYRLRLAAIQQ